MTDLQAQWQFFQELEHLKTIQRQNKTLDDRYENPAEHSWQLALMALTLRQHFPESVNLEKVLLLLLLHDIGEIGAGDTSTFDEKGKVDAYDRELTSVKQTFALLPPKQEATYLKLWNEFENGNSPEARYARCIDAIAPLMNHLLIAEEGENPDNLTKDQVIAKKAFIADESPALWAWVTDMIHQSAQKGLYSE